MANNIDKKENVIKLIKVVIVVLIVFLVIAAEGNSFKYLLDWNDGYLIGYNFVTLAVTMIAVCAIYFILRKKRNNSDHN